MHERRSVHPSLFRNPLSSPLCERGGDRRHRGKVIERKAKGETYPKQMARFAEFILFAEACSWTRFRCCGGEGGALVFLRSLSLLVLRVRVLEVEVGWVNGMDGKGETYERQGAECGVVGVGEAVDDGVESVAPLDVVVDTYF